MYNLARGEFLKKHGIARLLTYKNGIANLQESTIIKAVWLSGIKKTLFLESILGYEIR